jgi:hypothetical protein
MSAALSSLLLGGMGVAICVWSATVRMFWATGARFLGVLFSPLKNAFGESCRYSLEK